MVLIRPASYCGFNDVRGEPKPMAYPLIATKLLVPRLRREVVHRARLHELMDQGAQSRLTLISAPAGFGKTTLLVDWLAVRNAAAVWISLDATDNEAAAFWAYLIAAVGSATNEHVSDLPPVIMMSDRPPDRSTTVGLLNALAALDGELRVVLDDLHVIEDAALLAELSFFIDHLPDNIQMVISTRADPPLPLARLRARGELTEVRSADLRFQPGEVASYFDHAAHLRLDESDVARLEQRTEGWVAALQLAALSMQGRADISAFVANFAGSDRYVVDYLVEEVLRGQPETVRRFLFGTAILGRFSAELCDAVLDSRDSREIIDLLDRQNLFVVALDDRRLWHRYHHLFADVLEAHMPKPERDQLPERHRRASLWFEEHGDRDEAIRHALAAPDVELAADLIERAIPEMRQRRRVSVLRGAIEALPDSLVRARPALSINLVGPLLTAGVTEGVEERLSEAETRFRSSSEAALREFIGAIELFRSALAQMRGDMPAAVDHAQRVFDLAPASAYLERAGAAGFLAIVSWSSGELDRAQRHWADCTQGLLQIGYVADALGTMYARGRIAIAQARLGDAEHVLKHGLALATERKGYALPGSADLRVGLAEVQFERGDFAGAHEQLAGSESADVSGMPQFPSRRLAILADIARAEGDLEEASTLLDDAARLFVGDFFPNDRPIAARRARLSILQRDWTAIERWQRESGISADMPPSYAHQYEHITLARFLLAKGDAGAAKQLLDRLMPSAERGRRHGVVAELSVLRALAFDAMGDAPAAQLALCRALDICEPSGLARVFVDEGEPIAKLLRVSAKGKTGSSYARRLLASFGAPSPPRPAAHPDLLEPLSDRELDVLRLLRSELGGPDIAIELRVSLNTLRTHTKNIYEKLGVNSRRAAVRRAEEMNLMRYDRPV